jgi:Nuclease-related domain
MAAGDRASEKARRAGEHVARLRQQLEQAERIERAWAAGAAGEALVAGKLDELARLGWLVLHDVHWPGRPKANLDHVLVGPGGVLVVDAKNWSGKVQVVNGILKQNGYSREKEVGSALQQSAALAAILEPQHRQLVQAWLCLIQQPELSALSSSGVQIHGLETISQAIAELPAVLDMADVHVIHAFLTEQLTAASSPTLLTTGNLDRTHAADAALERWRGTRGSTAVGNSAVGGTAAGSGSPAAGGTAGAQGRRSVRPIHHGRRRTRRGFGQLLRVAITLLVVLYLVNTFVQTRQAVPTTPVIDVTQAPSVAQTSASPHDPSRHVLS